MSDILQIGLSGMRAAETQVTASASNIVNMNTKGYVPVQAVLKSSTSGGVQASIQPQTLSPETQAAIADIPGGAEDFVSDAVSMKMAETAYKASAKVIETANQMQDVLLAALSSGTKG